MKIVKILCFFLSIFAITLFSACDKSTETIAPSVFVNVIGTPSYIPGSIVHYEIVASSGTGNLKSVNVIGSGSIAPGEGSKIVSTSPEGLWNSETEVFAEGTREIKVYYDLVVDPLQHTGVSFGIVFVLSDYEGKYASSTQSITIPVYSEDDE